MKEKNNQPQLQWVGGREVAGRRSTKSYTSKFAKREGEGECEKCAFAGRGVTPKGEKRRVLLKLYILGLTIFECIAQGEKGRRERMKEKRCLKAAGSEKRRIGQRELNHLAFR